MTTRADVVACARTWIDTPFQHQQRTRRVAVDCAGLVIGVARELELVAASFDVTGYARSPDGRSLSALCREHMTAIERDAMQPGDVVEIAFASDPQHLGILGDYLHGGLSIIHAAAMATTPRHPLGRVVEHRLMFSEALKFVAAYRLPGLED